MAALKGVLKMKETEIAPNNYKYKIAKAIGY
jgi:hypothetical protein